MPAATSAETFKVIGEIPQKTECSYEPENGLNERGVENDICGLETAVFLIILIVTLLVATLYSVYCVMLKAIKKQIKIDHTKRSYNMTVYIPTIFDNNLWAKQQGCFNLVMNEN